VLDLNIKRIPSFIILTLVYIVATVAGIFTYLSLELDTWLSLLIADAVATVVTFIFSLIFKNASVYDPYWSVQPIVIVLCFAWGRALSLASVIVICVIAIWAIRLTANWAYTFHGMAHQDWRYTMLCEKTGKLYPIINFVGIHMVPTLVVYACTLPAVYLIINDATLSPVSLIFACVSLLGVTLQAISDIQMHKYRKNRTTPFIRNGLWKNSRHPNYLGEILMWWGVGAFCVLNMPSMWYLIAGAILNNLLFLFVSVPLADGRQSKKEGFEQYKKETRMFLPIKRFR
jgi:steroid 5-alpha reductase family enzyme